MIPNLCNDLLRLGATESNIRWLDRACAENSAYLDLISSSKAGTLKMSEVTPQAVVESDSHALIYILCADRLSAGNDDVLIQQLRHNLACRAEARYLAIWRSGELDIYPLGLSPELPQKRTIKIDENRFLFHQMVVGGFECSDESPINEVQELLSGALEYVGGKIMQDASLNKRKNIILSLLSMAFFMRFLVDRRVITREMLTELCKSDPSGNCLGNEVTASLTYDWIKEHFGSSAFPFSNFAGSNHFKELGESSDSIFHRVGLIMEPAAGCNNHISARWNAINFAFIPAEHVIVALKGHMDSCFPYSETVRRTSHSLSFVSDLMVNQAFDALNPAQRYQAKILDPCCGSGIILATTLRRLFKEHWLLNNQLRPDYVATIKIVNNQIAGFDNDEASLGLSAFGLLLTAIELNDNLPTVDKALNISSENLVHAKESDIASENRFKERVFLGGHEGSYDIVLGDPPCDFWLESGTSMPQPFALKAMEWAKPKGIISFTFCSRDTLFSAIHVMGLISGAKIDESELPSILFAKNDVPQLNACMKFIPWKNDALVKKTGWMRIDYAKAQLVQLSYLKKNPNLLHTLSVGTQLDASVIRRIESRLIPNQAEDLRLFQRLGSYWSGSETASTNIPKGLGRKEQKRAELLKKILGSAQSKGSVDDFLGKKTSTQKLVVINKYPPTKSQNLEVRLEPTSRLLVANNSLLTFDSSWHANSEILTKYLFLLTSSDLFAFYTLISDEIFCKKGTLSADAVNNFPILPVELLLPKEIEDINFLYREKTRSKFEPDAIDNWVIKLYGLDEYDQQIISDTLSTSLPFSSCRQDALKPPSEAAVVNFCALLENEINQFFSLVGDSVSCTACFSDSSPFISINIQSPSSRQGDDVLSNWLASYLAENPNASQIIHREGLGSIKVGVLAQRKYWTGSQSRLLALDIVRNYRDQFPTPTE